MQYYAAMLSRDEIAAADPFGGSGIRLAFSSGIPWQEAEYPLAPLLEEIPHVVWGTHVWADTAGLTAEEISRLRTAWERIQR